MSEENPSRNSNAAPNSDEIDPVTAEVVRHALTAIPDQLDVNITRTAYSPLIYEYKDYAVGIVDAEGRLVSQCRGGIPLFITNTLGTAVRDGLKIYGRDGIKPGDAIVTNYAESQGQHLNNVVLYTPVHDDAGELFGFIAIVVHWVDIGGSTQGSISNSSTEIFQEGLQLHTIKLISEGERVEEVFRIIEHNTRTPEMLFGDIQAQIAGCMLGREMLAGVLSRYGTETVTKAIQRMWERSETMARRAVEELPDGTYSAESFIDGDGVDQDRKIRVAIEVRVQGDTLTVDMSGVEDQLRGPLNSGFSGGAETAARIAFAYLSVPGEPVNEGVFRPLTVICPKGKFLNARRGAPMGRYSGPLPTVIDTIIKALSPACPDRVAAGHYADFSLFRIYGTHPETGSLFNAFASGWGGWGALAGMDGPGPFKTMAHGDVFEIPAELHEALYPVRVDSYAVRMDSGGAGEYRGGMGLVKRYSVTSPCNSFVSLDRVTTAAWGIEGGKDGGTGKVILHRPGKPPRSLVKEWEFKLVPGDYVEVMTGGGGGYGDPSARNPQRVAEDVLRGYVSSEAAQSVYGVALDEDGKVDSTATEKLRKALSE
jgi:N-methylhydantoinase B